MEKMGGSGAVERESVLRRSRKRATGMREEPQRGGGMESHSKSGVGIRARSDLRDRLGTGQSADSLDVTERQAGEDRDATSVQHAHLRGAGELRYERQGDRWVAGRAIM